MQLTHPEDMHIFIQMCKCINVYVSHIFLLNPSLPNYIFDGKIRYHVNI